MSGEFDQAQGRVKQAVGDLTDDEQLHREGEADEAAGKLKDKVDEVVESAKDKANDLIDKIRN